MHDPQTWEIQPERQRLEPIRDFPVPMGSLDLLEERLVLFPIARLVMISQEFPRMLRIARYPRDRVEFVIPENASSRTHLDHRPHEIHGRGLLRPTIDQVSYKDGRAARVSPTVGGFGIAQTRQE
jgi:hypothetical protein